MKYLSLFIVFITLSLPKVDAQRRVTYTDKNFSYTIIIDSIKLRFESYKADSNVKSIVIARLKDNKIIQTIIPREQLKTTFHHSSFIVMDMNFDGNNDIRLLENNKGINSSYYCWLYNPATEKFEENKELENITSPEVDSTNKQVTSLGKGGAGSFGYSIYQFKNGKYILIESRGLDRYTDKKDSVLLTIEKRKNEKMVPVLKRYYSDPDFDRIGDSLFWKP